MKTNRFFTSIYLLLLSTLTVVAQQNTLSVPDVSVAPGTSISLPVILNNTADIVALQFTLIVPEGVSLTPSAASVSERGVDHTVTMRNPESNRYTAILFSSTNRAIVGRTGTLLTIPLRAPSSLAEGTELPFTLSDVVITRSDGSNVATGFSAGKLSVRKSPDFELSGVNLRATSLAPNSMVVVDWQVANIGGLPTASGWTESVFLDSSDGVSKLLSTLYYVGSLNSGGLLSRSAEIQLPQVIGIDGEATVRIRLTPNSDSGEPSWLRENNVASTLSTITVQKTLSLSPTNASVDEAAGRTHKFQLTRSGSTIHAEEFTLNLPVDNRVTLPESITIPQGQSGVYFYATITPNGVLDDQATVTFSCTGNGYSAVEALIAIEDDTYPSLSLSSNVTEMEEGESFVLTIAAQRPPHEDLEIRLACDHASRFNLPSSIVLSAGRLEVETVVSAKDDDIPNVDEVVTFTVSAPSYNSASETVILVDNDVPNLQLVLTPTAISEEAGPTAISASIRRTNNIDKSITVKLSDDSNGQIYYSRNSIEMAAGVEEAIVSLGPIDNIIVDRERTYTISAAVYIASCRCSAEGASSGGSASVPLTLYDNDGPSLSLSVSASVLNEGGELNVTITRNTSTVDPLVVSLSSNQDGNIEYPTTATIPSGHSSVTVSVKSRENQTTGDSYTAVLTAQSAGYSPGNTWFTVTDQTLPDAQITVIQLSETSGEVGGNITVSLTVANTGSYQLAESTKVVIYMSNSGSPITTIYLQSPLAAGETVELSKEVVLPQAVGSFGIYAVVNEGREVQELTYTNNTSKMVSVQINSPFSATVSSDKISYKQGETVKISGRISGHDVANKTIDVYLINDNYRNVWSVETLHDGSFETTYKPYDREMGHFILGACYPGENSALEMASFDLYGIKRVSTTPITCQMLLGDTFNGSFEIVNPGNNPQTGLKITILSKPDNCSTLFNCEETIEGGGTLSVSYAMTANAVTVGGDWQQLVLNIETDEGASYTTTLYFYCQNKLGQLKASVSRINTTMIKGTSRDYPFVVTNTGIGETGRISLELPAWMSSVTPREMASLATGDSVMIILRFTPTNDMQLNVPVTGSIGLNCTNGNGLSLPFHIEPVSESEGTLTIDVCNESTYYTAEAPHLQGAKVLITHPTTGATIYSGVTGEDGLCSTTLPEGYYAVSVTAQNHSSYRNNVLVDPGVEKRVVVNLSFEAITVDWQVEETEVTDEYAIVTTVKFETSVPVPVVELAVPSTLELEELVSGESLLFYAALTNKGLITAQDVALLLPEAMTAFSFEALAYTTPFDLAPQQSVLIPVKVTKTPSAMRTPMQRTSSSSDGCVMQVATIYYWDCGVDRKYHRYPMTIQYKSCPSNSSGWVSTGFGGLLGPVGGSGSGPTTTSSSSSAPTISITDTGCTPCISKKTIDLALCATSFIPGLGCVTGVGKCGWDLFVSQNYGWRTWSGCAISVAGCVPAVAATKYFGDILNGIGCFVSLSESCDLAAPASLRALSTTRSSSNEPGFITQMRERAAIPLAQLEAFEGILLEFFGDAYWIHEVEVQEIELFLLALTDSEEQLLTPELYLVHKPASVSTTQYSTFIERLNNTTRRENGESISTNYIDEAVINSYYDLINNAEEQSLLLGYESTESMFAVEYQNYLEKLNESSGAVCSSITLQFSQSMVMTRQAFRGTLTVYNGNEALPMTEVKLTLEVADQSGTLATSHQFQINPESLNGFSGNLNFTDGWSLDADETGVATILFIPTKYAAPTVEQQYAFGGSLSYTDPFTGLTVTRELSPVTLTVKPSPNLDLTYFMQRDVMGDDPLTETIEPSEEAEFALLINNVGYGDATQVRLVTNQPEIVENEKGLLIDFELISSQLNGGDKTLALGGSAATDFGTIPSKSTAYAQWWLRSSLLGHFSSYEIAATHVTSYDNPDLSLLNEVTLHELVRSLEVVQEADTIVGFMTNDIVDANDTPDMLYLSNGEIENVYSVNSSTLINSSDTDYILTVVPSKMGWHYGHLTDPTYGLSALKSVTRQRDGKQISLRNFWQTDRTLRDGREPLYENRIHFADNFSGFTSSESYLLTFEPTPELLLEVASVEGLPMAGTISFEPINTVKVMFNKAIDPTTFTTADLAVAVQGVNQETSVVAISTDDNKNFTLDLSLLNNETGNGYYTLSVQTKTITDVEGYTGKNGKSVGWIMFRDGLVTLNTSTYPELAGTVLRLGGNTSRAADSSNGAEYGSTVKLSAQANAGYEFTNWTLNGEVISTDLEFESLAISDMEVVANFTPKSYNVTFTSDHEGGIVAGSYVGVYRHGDQFTLNAMPFVNYLFDHWIVNGEVVSATDSLTLTVDQPLSIGASFTRDVYQQRISMFRGWNWVSSYLNEPLPLTSIISHTNRIVSQFGELVKDPEYGMVGDIENFISGAAYKVESSVVSTTSFDGRLHDVVQSPITLKRGWNWISYLYFEQKSILAVIINPSEGDYLTGQSGFTEYADGYWEGTLDVLTPGYGYLYKSTTDKVLTFEFITQSNSAMGRSKSIAVDEQLYFSIDMRQYPHTMSVTAKLYHEDQEIGDNSCRIYAISGDEIRGVSQYVGNHYYLSVYGDSPVNILFVVENLISGETFIANESLKFSSDVVGSRNAPYHITLGEATTIDQWGWNSEHQVKIYSIEGILISADATLETIKRLPRGIYIINGKKYLVK